MKNALHQFDHIQPLLPSDDWERKRVKLLKQAGTSNAPQRLLSRTFLFTLLLIFGNLIVFLCSIENKEVQNQGYREIAAEILIFSDSAQF